MEYVVFVMRDNKVGFLTPSFDLNEEVAKRNFAYALTNNQLMNFSPADFDLFKLGTYNTETGNFTLLEIPECVMSGYSVFKGEN